MNNRFIWADIIRILAIYFIVVLHVVTLPSPQKADFLFFIVFTLIHTCVPLLVMVSGSLLLGKKESYLFFFRKRFVRVIVPWISWTSIFTIITAVSQANYTLGNSLDIFHHIFIPFFWFIVLVCALYVLTPALRIFVQKAKIQDTLFVIVLWFISISILPSLRDTQAFPWHVDNGVVRLVIDFIGYFLLGFLLVKIKQKRHYLFFSIAIFILSVLLTSFVAFYLTHTIKEYAVDTFAYISPGIVIATASLFFLLYQLEAYYQKFFTAVIKKVLRRISKATLGIYFIHYFFLNRPPLPQFVKTTSFIHISSDIDLFINGFFLFAISFLLIYLLQKIPIISHFIA